MLRRSTAVAVFVTCYLIIYCAFFLAGATMLVEIMFMPAPFLMLWLVITMLKDNKASMPELKEGEEWGYADRDRNAMNTF